VVVRQTYGSIVGGVVQAVTYGELSFANNSVCVHPVCWFVTVVCAIVLVLWTVQLRLQMVTRKMATGEAFAAF
jgi:hypothetical protein